MIIQDVPNLSLSMANRKAKKVSAIGMKRRRNAYRRGRSPRFAAIIQAMTLQRATVPFQICGSCKNVWPTWRSFVLDPAVRLLGLQSDLTHLDINLIVFEHGCGSAISILSKRLHHLLPEPRPADPAVRLLGTEECQGHCLLLGDLEACDAFCSNARDRELIQFIQRMRKVPPRAAPNEPNPRLGNRKARK
jgi:hypothetical protein